MKKILIPILIAVIAAAAGAYYYMGTNSAAVTSPESILPADTIALIEVRDLEKGIEEMWNTKLGENLKKIDISSTAMTLDLPEDIIENLDSFKKEFYSGPKKEAFFNIFGKDFSIALTSVKIPENIDHDINLKENMPGIALLSVPKTSAKLTQMLSNAVPQIKKVKEIDYNGTTIIESSFDDELSFFHFVEKEFLVATLSEDAAKEIIDSSKSGKTLASTDRFKSIKKDIDSATRDFLLFLDMEKIYGKIEETARKFPSRELRELMPKLNNGFKYVAYAGFPESKNVYKTNTRLKQSFKNEAAPQKPSHFLSMVPDDVIAFSWQNNFDLKKFVKQILGTDEAIESFEKRLVFEFGITTNKLYTDLAGEIGLVFKDIENAGMFPVPSIAFIFEDSAKRSFDEFITFVKNREDGAIPLQKKTINGYEVNYVPLPFGKALEPSWALIDGSFIFSINSALIQNMTDALKKKENIENNDLYKFVNKDLPKKCNAASFFNSKKFFLQLIGTSESVSRLMAMRNPYAIEKTNIIIKDVVTPLFEGLSMYEATGQKGYFKEDDFYAKSITKIEP